MPKREACLHKNTIASVEGRGVKRVKKRVNRQIVLRRAKKNKKECGGKLLRDWQKGQESISDLGGHRQRERPKGAHSRQRSEKTDRGKAVLMCQLLLASVRRKVGARESIEHTGVCRRAREAYPWTLRKSEWGTQQKLAGMRWDHLALKENS